MKDDNIFRYFAPEKLAVIPEGHSIPLSLKTTREMMSERDEWIKATVKCPTCDGTGRTRPIDAKVEEE